MKKMRVLLAAAGAAVVMSAVPAPAQAGHHCPYPPVDDEFGVVYTAWVVCENWHNPGPLVDYFRCVLKPGC